jgi:predicted PurR-regulated permease PerM
VVQAPWWILGVIGVIVVIVIAVLVAVAVVLYIRYRKLEERFHQLSDNAEDADTGKL